MRWSIIVERNRRVRDDNSVDPPHLAPGHPQSQLMKLSVGSRVRSTCRNKARAGLGLIAVCQMRLWREGELKSDLGFETG